MKWNTFVLKFNHFKNVRSRRLKLIQTNLKTVKALVYTCFLKMVTRFLFLILHPKFKKYRKEEREKLNDFLLKPIQKVKKCFQINHITFNKSKIEEPCQKICLNKTTIGNRILFSGRISKSSSKSKFDNQIIKNVSANLIKIKTANCVYEFGRNQYSDQNLKSFSEFLNQKTGKPYWIEEKYRRDSLSQQQIYFKKTTNLIEIYKALCKTDRLIIQNLFKASNGRKIQKVIAPMIRKKNMINQIKYKIVSLQNDIRSVGIYLAVYESLRNFFFSFEFNQFDFERLIKIMKNQDSFDLDYLTAKQILTKICTILNPAVKIITCQTIKMYYFSKKQISWVSRAKIQKFENNLKNQIRKRIHN